MKILNDKLRFYWKKTREYCVHNILHADDPPHRLALGIAIGMFVTFTPTIGFQMGIVFFLAWIFRANKLVGLPLVWISNPATLVPVYYPCYWLGCKLLGRPIAGTEWIKSLTPPDNLGILGTLRWGFGKLVDIAVDIAAPLWLGCIVIGGVLGVLSYYVSLFCIRSYRLKRWGQLLPPSATPEKPADFEPTTESQPTPSKSSSENAA